MRLLTTPIFCLILTLYPFCTHAEISTISHQDTPANISTVSLRQEQNTITQDIQQTEPLVIYQQALNHLLGRNGMTKSTEKAAHMFKMLAEQNWSSAQLMLGNMYLSGKGVEKNDLLAYKWLSLASKNNLQLAEAIHTKRQQLYEKLQSNLSLQALNKIETWIAEWEPSRNITQIN